MQLKLELKEAPEPTLIDRFGILIVVLVLLLIAFANRPLKAEENKEKIKSPEPFINEGIPRLTVSQLRKYPGFENISDEECEKYLDTSARLSRLICEFIKNK